MEVSRLIQNAINHIEQNLCSELALEDISDVANYSPWHFHRLFVAHTGMGVAEYIRRRRLSEAALQLRQSSLPISGLATKYGFESQAAFTRAFGKAWGISPAKFRREHISIPLQAPIQVSHYHKGVKMINAQIKHKPAFRVIGIRCRTTMQTNSIPQLWDDFGSVCDRIPNPLVPNTAIGICYGDPEVEMTPETPFYYLAGMEVSTTQHAPADMLSMDLPAGDYAVFEHHGALDNLHDTYQAIYEQWFAKADYKPRGDFDFELYDERFDYGKPESVMEIWVPVVKK